MFLHALNWLLKFAGLSLHAKAKEEKSLPRLHASGDNVIEVDFLRGARKQRTSAPSIDVDDAKDALCFRLELPPHVHTRMNAIKRMSGAESHVETIRRALSTYDTLVELHAEGRAVGFYDQRGDWVEIDMSFR